jgi:hypothetical protein
MFYVKCKGPRDKIYWFLTPAWRLNRLRIHAVAFDSRDKAEAAALEIAQENKGFSARVVTRTKGGTCRPV